MWSIDTLDTTQTREQKTGDSWLKNHYGIFKLKLSTSYERVQLKLWTFHQYTKISINILVCNGGRKLLISLLQLNIATTQREFGIIVLILNYLCQCTQEPRIPL